MRPAMVVESHGRKIEPGTTAEEGPGRGHAGNDARLAETRTEPETETGGTMIATAVFVDGPAKGREQAVVRLPAPYIMTYETVEIATPVMMRFPGPEDPVMASLRETKYRQFAKRGDRLFYTIEIRDGPAWDHMAEMFNGQIPWEIEG